MWTSSRRVVLFAAGVLLFGSAAVGVAWLTKTLPIEFGEPSQGELVSVDNVGSEPSGGDLGVGFRQGLPDFSGQSEPDPDQRFEPEVVVAQQTQEASADPFARDGGSREMSSSRVARERPLGRPEQPTELFFPAQPQASESEPPQDFPAFDPSSQRADRAANVNRGVIQPTAFEKPAPDSRSSSTEEFAEPRTFEPQNPRSLQQAQKFPKQVALLDRFQSEAPPQELEPAKAASDPVVEPLGSAPPSLPAQDDMPTIEPFSEPTRPRIAARVEPELDGSSDFRKIDALLEKGDLVTAHRELSTLYWSKPELKRSILPRIEKTAKVIYFDQQPHFVEPYVIQSGDKLERIAAKYQVPWQYLVAVNRVDPRRIRVGQKLKVIKGPMSVFVDLSDFELTVHAHGFFVKRYTVGIGKDGASPIGKFTVLEKVEKPQYTDPNGKVTAGGAPTNPLGTHWIDIGNSFGIHGTIEPDSIGKAESRGCIRMRNDEVAEVYSFLVKGSEVVIRQ